MKSLNTIENRIDYLAGIISCILLFVASKNIIPTFIYSFLALAIAFYFFPLRLLINKNFVSSERLFIIITGIIFSSLLVFSILYLYVNESLFFRNIIIFFSLSNFILMIFFYQKFNKFLFLNFIFTFLSSILLF